LSVSIASALGILDRDEFPGFNQLVSKAILPVAPKKQLLCITGTRSIG
jgi:hypothetical protein